MKYLLMRALADEPLTLEAENNIGDGGNESESAPNLCPLRQPNLLLDVVFYFRIALVLMSHEIPRSSSSRGQYV